MARGFGATLGTGVTDVVTTTYTASGSTTRSWAIWTNRHGPGGSNRGRMFDKRTGGVQSVLFYTTEFGSTFFDVQWTTAGQWSFNTPSSDVWHHAAITYDSGSGANDPVIYIDGSTVTLSKVAPTGTIVTNAGAYTIGGRDATDATWNGQLAEFAIWDNAILNAAEVSAIARGYSPLFVRPNNLVEYVPLVQSNVSYLNAAPAITGTVVQPHPRIIMPRKGGKGMRLRTPIQLQFVGFMGTSGV